MVDKEEKTTESEAEEPKMEEPEEAKTAESEDDGSAPFPRARIVSIMKSEIKDRQIRSEVKEAMNIWLGALLKRVSKEMGKTQYGSIGIADFQRATKPYDMMEDIVKDEERLMVSLDKLKLDSDAILREMKRFFSVVKGTEGEDSPQ